MSDGKKFGWGAIVGTAIASVLATLLICVLIDYYFVINKKIHPGIDFPVAWPGREQLGDSYESYLSIEEFGRASRLSRLQQAYASWCAENSLAPRANQSLIESY